MIVARLLLHLLCLAPLVWLCWAIPEGLLGGDPIKELIHFLGIGALRLALFTLAIAPLAKFLKIGRLLKFRRAIGLWCFIWASLHFMTWLALDLAFDWPLFAGELIKRSYIILGFIAWVILSILAITSIPKLLRKLGKRWKKIHSLIYLATLVICVHFWWSVKSGWLEPAIYLCCAILLLSLRKNKLLISFRKA